ncbi:MAG: cytochrome C554 [Pirellulaceae bacterium]|nr:cytochrome C554 [Pirellulaceae bacterium]
MMLDPNTHGKGFFDSSRLPSTDLTVRWQAFVRQRRRLALWLGSVLVTGMTVGCSDAPPVAQRSETELRISLPTGGSDTGDLRNTAIVLPEPPASASQKASAAQNASAAQKPDRPRLYRSSMSVGGANARLVSMESNRPSADRVKWGMDQLHTHLQPPTTSLESSTVTFIQVSQPTPAPQQNSPPIEIVPTPEPIKVIPPEMIPTPEGKRDGDPGKDTKPGEPDERMAKNVEPAADSSATPDADPLKLNPVTDEGAAAIPPALAPESYTKWPKPDVTLFVTGQQNGYIEPCGCTGLEKQKGGVARRFTLMKQLRDNGWDLVPIDAGNQIRRVGQQALVKLSWSTEALKKMDYQSVGFGPDDMRLPTAELLAMAASDSPEEATYVSANVVLLDASYMPALKVIDREGMKIGLTNILDPESLEEGAETDAEIKPIVQSAQSALDAMTEQGATFRVLTFYGSEESAADLMRSVPGYDLIVVAGGYGEPTYKPTAIDDSKTQMIVTGNKAMYAGLVGLYKDQPMKYARVPLTHEFSDAPEMRELMGQYQEQLKQLGFNALGLEPTPHLSGQKFVGTATCAKCHEDAFDVWSGSGHAHATDSIVSPPEDRGDVPRHFDPECLSCHVTGWSPEHYHPYESGYESLAASNHLLGNGCENCHGPGSGHSQAETDGSGVSDADKEALRKGMQLSYDKAREHCMKCHDLDNSPDFHEPDAFEDEYWPEIAH